jgi:hypothetical protein
MMPLRVTAEEAASVAVAVDFTVVAPEPAVCMPDVSIVAPGGIMAAVAMLDAHARHTR